MPTQYQSASTIFAAGLETTYGTQAASLTTIPVKNPKMLPNPVFLDDTGFRGSPVDIYDQVTGVSHNQYDFEGNLYADTFPIFMMMALGGPDVKTGGGPYSHVIGLYNNFAASQPYSASVQAWDGANQYAPVGCRMDNLKITLTAEQDAVYTASIIGQTVPTATTSAPTPSPSTEVMMPGWDFAVTVAGGGIAYVEKFEMEFQRKTKPIFTGGQRTPHSVFAAGLNLIGTMDCVVDANNDPFTTGATPYATFRQSSPLTLSVVLTDPISSHTLTWQMSSVQFMAPDRNTSKEWVTYTTQWKASANATDTTVADGFSPCKFTASNAVATAYTGS